MVGVGGGGATPGTSASDVNKVLIIDFFIYGI